MTHFTKMQATGNDFIVIDARSGEKAWSELARAMCQRHFGVGADGLILVLPSSRADFRMTMINPDGSEAEACGNGLRCFVRYVLQKGLASKQELRIETLAGIRDARSDAQNVRVGMGSPRFAPAEIPTSIRADTVPVLDFPLEIGGQELKLSLVSMGNPHAVCFLDAPVADFPLAAIGPQVEHHPVFPNRTNFEIVNELESGQLRARVWERGAGETLSCGSGACAVAVAARLRGRAGEETDIDLPGGVLRVGWSGRGEVWLSGPAEMVFEGERPDEQR